jgi:Domain of unknown function (DUF1918)
MELKAGDRVVAESESTEREPRRGVVEEVLGSGSTSRYRIRWDDRRETIYTPAAGALHRVPAERGEQEEAEQRN